MARGAKGGGRRGITVPHNHPHIEAIKALKAHGDASWDKPPTAAERNLPSDQLTPKEKRKIGQETYMRFNY